MRDKESTNVGVSLHERVWSVETVPPRLAVCSEAAETSKDDLVGLGSTACMCVCVCLSAE